MPRSVELTLPQERTDALVEQLRGMEGLISLRVWRGASVQPPGDVLCLEVTNETLHHLTGLLQAQGLGQERGLSLTSNQPLSVIAANAPIPLTMDSNNATWEEMESRIGRESNMGINGLLIMAISGALSVLGIANNTLHIVVGAMLVAPGFEPILRVSLGLASGGHAMSRGVQQTARAYGALVLGAGLMTAVLRVLGHASFGGKPSYLPAYELLSYFTTISAPGVLASLVASVAGALLIATNRSVLSTGVMAALALVPAASLVGVGLVMADFSLVAKGALRWLIEVGLVTGMGALALAWKRRTVQPRKTMS